MELGVAVTVDKPASATAVAVKVTVGLVLTVMPSVISVAVNVGVPGVRDFTVKVTTPEALDGPDAAEIVSVAPRLEARVTVLPTTGAELASSKVTVMVEVVTPSAVTEVGEATTVELRALAGTVGTSLIWPGVE